MAEPAEEVVLECAPGESAPASGSYELLNVMGSAVGNQVSVTAGQALPPTPFGWIWRLATGPAPRP